MSRRTVEPVNRALPSRAEPRPPKVPSSQLTEFWTRDVPNWSKCLYGKLTESCRLPQDLSRKAHMGPYMGPHGPIYGPIRSHMGLYMGPYMGPYGPQPGPGPNPDWAPTRPGLSFFITLQLINSQIKSSLYPHNLCILLRICELPYCYGC